MKSRLTKNLGLKIISVILAILLWLVVLNVSDPDTTATISNIPITITNEDAITGQEKVYKIASGKTATVEVTGPRTIVDSLEPSSFIATADLAKLSMTNAVEVEVELKTVSHRSKIDIDVQTTVIISVEDLLEEEFVIEGQEKGAVPTGYVVYNKTIGEDRVIVKAPTSVMNQIAKVVAPVNVSGATEDFTTAAELQACDSRGNVIDPVENNISFDISSTSVDVVIYSVKQIPLTYEILEDEYINTIFTATDISKKNITIAGREAVLNDIEELVLDTSALNVTEDQDKYTLTFDIPSLLPAGVYLYGDDSTVTITIETDAVIRKTYTIPVADIAIKTPAEGYTAYIETTGELTYTLEGRKSILDDFVPGENMLYVSAKNLVEGQYEVEVLMDLEEGITQVGSLKVAIKVVSKENITEDTSTSEESTEENSSTDESTTLNNADNSTEGDESSPSEEETTPVGAEPTDETT